MNPGMKMMLVTNARKGDSGRSGDRSDRSGGRMDYREDNYARMNYDGAESNYDAENRFRDRRGREHYDNGRFAPRSDYDDMETRMGMDDPESRRRRDSRGRFRSDGGYSRMGDDDWMEDTYREGRDRSGRTEAGWYPNRPFPVYEGGNRMNQIGFNAGGTEFPSEYRMEATHQTGNEMEYMQGQKMGGYSSGKNHSLTKEMADEWTGSMKNEDGTKGPHWTMEQVKQVMAQKGIDTNPVEMWAVLNMMYSDYCSVFKKHGVNKMDLYVDLACAWLNDKDAQSGKTARYFEEVVKH